MSCLPIGETSQHERAMAAALDAARAYLGATAPNPPVGATITDVAGNILTVAAHTAAGQPHAEAAAIAALRQTGQLPAAHRLYVTLEPCHHHGRTPPCTSAILATPIAEIYYAVPDPDPRVAGQGHAALVGAGRQVRAGLLAAPATWLMRAYLHWQSTRRPWVTVKQALRPSGSMRPPTGQRTFTSPAALRLAHRLRKRVDALITTRATLLADQPQLTVRHVPDHPQKQRWLALCSRDDWPEGFQPAPEFRRLRHENFTEICQQLGAAGCHEVLIEAGPRFLAALAQNGGWHEWLTIQQQPPQAQIDELERVTLHYQPALPLLPAAWQTILWPAELTHDAPDLPCQLQPADQAWPVAPVRLWGGS